jgi:hypothetical protein
MSYTLLYSYLLSLQGSTILYTLTMYYYLLSLLGRYRVLLSPYSYVLYTPGKIQCSTISYPYTLLSYNLEGTPYSYLHTPNTVVSPTGKCLLSYSQIVQPVCFVSLHLDGFHDGCELSLEYIDLGYDGLDALFVGCLLRCSCYAISDIPTSLINHVPASEAVLEPPLERIVF